MFLIQALNGYALTDASRLLLRGPASGIVAYCRTNRYAVLTADVPPTQNAL